LYNIIFKVDGAVEGSGSSSEGSFTIEGVYNGRSGTVAWRQESVACPAQHIPLMECTVQFESEFFGEVSNFLGPGPAQITGTLLTDLGLEFAVSLVFNSSFEAETGPTSTTRTNTAPKLLSRIFGRWLGKQSTKANAENTESNTEREALPTLLLASRWKPDVKSKGSFFPFVSRGLKRQQANDSDLEEDPRCPYHGAFDPPHSAEDYFDGCLKTSTESPSSNKGHGLYSSATV